MIGKLTKTKGLTPEALSYICGRKHLIKVKFGLPSALPVYEIWDGNNPLARNIRHHSEMALKLSVMGLRIGRYFGRQIILDSDSGDDWFCKEFWYELEEM